MNQAINVIINILYHGLEYYGRFYSSYRGIVEDRIDPSGQGRLRLRVPGVIDTVTDYWAPSIGTYSGQGYGAHVIPNVGDIVWVKFENGDPNKPIWSMGYFGKQDITDSRYSDPNNYWFITPSGHVVEMNDSSGEFTLRCPTGETIIVKKNSVSVRSTKIYLGSIDDADEPGVLGDTLEEILKAIMSQMGGLAGAVSSLGAGLASSAVNMSKGVPPNIYTAALITTMAAAGLGAEAQAKTFAGKAKAFVNNLNNIIGKLGKMKSKTVKLNK